ncbi:hypothetical protein PPL_04943 [Heterostelium album PN500]|uniref:Uncharacterized protein n=1 Tax=Heterostelium pallidum (strain ATCC 26659 / Pp 5 / PN500) TaxID=670386 RepID=D3B8Z9_HETP5|nr:hypothetical protein PPL_04943 [Heterostelium album PN500]EFA82038.1 hypothetical protein PPL_04943 [Heterostelium album PN500]|eukprot:XP_020434155.1 hypothetical protein PPL_04943 [Heterostelium album PN500]
MRIKVINYSLQKDMSFGKALQSVTVFIVIPLMLAVHSNKITLQAALDLIVWYIAVAFFIYIFKTPLKLYFIVKEKSLHLKDLQQINPDSEVVKNHLQELFTIEWNIFNKELQYLFIRLLTISSLSFQYYVRLLHCLVASFVTTYQPIFYVIDHFKKRMDELYSGVETIDFTLGGIGGGGGGSGVGVSTESGGSSSPNRVSGTDRYIIIYLSELIAH